MKIFHYNAISGVFLGEGEADADPMTPGYWLVPAHSTVVPVPQTVEGQAWLFDQATASWSSVADYRDVPLYSTVDGSSVDLSEEYWGLGPLPASVTTIMRPSEAHVWVEDAWQLDEALSMKLIRQANQSACAELQAVARSAIEPLQLADEIGEATEAEAAALLAWKRYIVALSRIDLSAPTWPEVPAQ